MNLPRKLSSQNPGGLVRTLIFFILFYLYLWLEVDLRLIYHSGGVISNFPAFFRGWEFSRQFMTYPGGPAEYLSAFLSQFFYYSWAGAFVVTMQAWLMFICTGYFFKMISAKCLYWIRFVPPMLLLITYNQYTYHFATTMAWLIAMFFVCLYLSIESSGTFYAQKNITGLFRLAVFLVLSVILYMVTGAAQLLFVILCAIYELASGRRWQTTFLYLLSALGIPYIIGVLVFDVSIIDAFSKLMPYSWQVLFDKGSRRMVTMVYILYLLVPLASLTLVSCQAIAGSLKFSKSRKEIFSRFFQNKKLRRIIESPAPFIIAGAVVIFSYNNNIKTFFEVDYYAFHKMWPETLESAHRHPTNNFYVVHSANRALYHTGRLGYDMFSYPQYPDTFFLPPKKTTEGYWQKFDTYIDLGLISRAEHALTISLDEFGERPMILKRLALVNIIKGNLDTAGIYLGALSKSLFDAHWANDYLKRLEQAQSLVINDRIQYLRLSMSKKDYGSLYFINEELMFNLLAKNRKNKMAFEYLMARYLLDAKLDDFIQNLYRLDDFKYSEIPPLYEEAILYMLYSGKNVELHRRRISADSQRRFTDFINIYSRYKGNKHAALKELKNKYGDSYLFYSLYGFSGAEK